MLAIYWHRPLTRLEIGLYAAIVGVLMSVFLERTLFYMELAERTAMQITVDSLNSALTMQRGFEMLQGQPMVRRDASPFELARMRVPNRHPDVLGRQNLDALERGYWVYDLSAKELIYLPNLHLRLQTEGGESDIRFRLVASANKGYKVVPAAHYSWP